MENELKEALAVLKKGGVILYPTDTIWGLGCDATNADAVAKIYKIKQRLESKSMLMLLGREDDLEYYVEDVPAIAYDLIATTDKPLTIIFDKGKNIARNLLGEDGSIGIRVTREKFSRQLCNRLRRPVVSTSANISGRPSPTNYADIDSEILSAVDYVVNYGRESRVHVSPSSIIKLMAGGVFKIIR